MIKLNKLTWRSHQPGGNASHKFALARFDYSPVQNLATQATINVGFTTNQKDLAVTLITKYAKQWKKRGYDVSNINRNTPTKNPLRATDSSKVIDVDETREIITVRFPYDPTLITQLYSYSDNQSSGDFIWNKEGNQWEVEVTTEHVAHISTLALRNNFTTTSAFNDLDLMMQNSFDFKSIYLDISDDGLTLDGAPDSMMDWIHDAVGELNMYNLDMIASLSDSMLFGLSASVLKSIEEKHGKYRSVIVNRNSWYKDIEEIPLIIDVLQDLNYKTIVVYANELTGDRAEELIEILERNTLFNLVIDDTPRTIRTKAIDRRIIMTNKVIPLVPDAIISTVGFTLGPNRKEWFRSARKNIYVCDSVNEKIKKITIKNERKFNNKR